MGAALWGVSALYDAVGSAAGGEIGYCLRHCVGAFHIHVMSGIGDGEAVEVGDVGGDFVEVGYARGDWRCE